MLNALRDNVFHFSAAKNRTELNRLSELLRDQNGKLRTYKDFVAEATKVTSDFQGRYMRVEYDLAVNAATLAARWQEYRDDDILVFRTARDARVRDSHKLLHGIAKPKNDPFWKVHYPPLSWNCRCTVVVSSQAKITPDDQLPPMDDKAIPPMFRSNFAEEGFIFSEKHPYYKSELSSDAKKIGEILLVDIKDFSELIRKSHIDYFERGFVGIYKETRKNNNGSTDMNGNIYLKEDRIKNCIEAINNMKKSKPTTYIQEDALSTLWHEINHNRNKIGNMHLSSLQTKYMEMANEFVSRNTLDTFISELGGKLQNKTLMSNRNSTGYNRMVKNYDSLVSFLKADKNKVIDKVQKHLFNEKYTNQEEGLLESLNTEKKIEIKKSELKKLLRRAISLNEADFNEILKTL